MIWPRAKKRARPESSSQGQGRPELKSRASRIFKVAKTVRNDLNDSRLSKLGTTNIPKMVSVEATIKNEPTS